MPVRIQRGGTIATPGTSTTGATIVAVRHRTIAVICAFGLVAAVAAATTATAAGDDASEDTAASGDTAAGDTIDVSDLGATLSDGDFGETYTVA